MILLSTISIGIVLSVEGSSAASFVPSHSFPRHLPPAPNRRHGHGAPRARAPPRRHGDRTRASAAWAPTAAAGGTLALSSLAGLLFERRLSRASGGHVATLLAAALLSNLAPLLPRRHGTPSFVVPSDHFLYDWCWSIFLPASLVLALLSSPPSASPNVSTGSSHETAATPAATKSRALRSTLLGMALPFLAGSVGSVLGCLASRRAVALPYPPRTTALLAGCLCASYIGGTVNFFATARALRETAGGDPAAGSAFGSLAAADLVVMAAYFALLSAAAKSAWLQGVFPSKCGIAEEAGQSRDGVDVEEDKPTANTSIWHAATAAVLAAALALVAVFVATFLERTVTDSFPPPFNPPGTMCAFLAGIGVVFERIIRHILSYNNVPGHGAPSSIFSYVANSLQHVSVMSPMLSDACFYLLFAAVGTTADLSSAVATGPRALVFAALALLVHSATVILVTRASLFAGTFLRKRAGILHKARWPRSSWQEVLTASNAAIGGPSTAAAFAAGLMPVHGRTAPEGRGIDKHQYRSALVIAATFWGVCGYAVATSVGVTLARMLMR